MARVIVYYAHPGHRHSHVNSRMFEAARALSDITLVDLYAEYPRFEIDVKLEQQRLIDHDVIVFQYPVFWYATPSLIKEWQDLVLEYGFAYGPDGDRLAGKRVQLAVTAGGPEEAYSSHGFQRYPLRTFLTPFEQTARLCQMSFSAPYVLYASLQAFAASQVEPHAQGYLALLEAIRDDRYDFNAADDRDHVNPDTLPILENA